MTAIQITNIAIATIAIAVALTFEIRMRIQRDHARTEVQIANDEARKARQREAWLTAWDETLNQREERLDAVSRALLERLKTIEIPPAFADPITLLTPIRDAVSEALADGADRLALCDALRDLADELDDVRTEPLEHGGTRVIVRGDVSVIYGREGTFTAYPTPRRIETIFPTIERAVRSIVRLAAARRNA